MRSGLTLERGRGDYTKEIIGSAIAAHRVLGPGLLESAYEECLAYELALRQIRFQRQVALPLEYKGVKLGCGYRIDRLVEDQNIVEIKAVSAIEPVHQAQLLTYMKLARCHIGLLINFCVPVLREGLCRLVL